MDGRSQDLWNVIKYQKEIYLWKLIYWTFITPQTTKIYNLQENVYINETLINDGWTEVLFIIKKGYKNNKLKKKKKTNDKKLL